MNRKDYRAWYGLGQAYEFLNMPQYALHYYQYATALRCVFTDNPLFYLVRVEGFWIAVLTMSAYGKRKAFVMKQSGGELLARGTLFHNHLNI